MLTKTIQLPRLTWQDYILAGIASTLAGFSAGMGLINYELAGIFVVLSVFGTVISAVLQRIMPPKFAALDGFFYAAVAIFCMFQYSALNDLLPNDGFPASLAVAGWLCWMLVFGTFFMWRDSTVLFQAVPGIAVFGLVGTWDTFGASPFVFFAFLLCFATLFARAHARTMLVRASESGFRSNALDINAPGGFWRALKSEPWRWAAGPEWALGSALAIIGLSVLGAPVLQWSLQGVAGTIKIPSPGRYITNRKNNATSASSATNFTVGDQYVVGNGPVGDLPKQEIFDVSVSGPLPYLRAHTYSTYTGRGWKVISAIAGIAGAVTDNPLLSFNAQASHKSREVPFQEQCLAGNFDSVPLPGDFAAVDSSGYMLRTDGTLANAQRLFSPGRSVGGSVRLTAMPANPEFSRDPLLAPYDNADQSMIIKDRVRQFAGQIIKGKKSDLEKAEAIRVAVSQRITYDVQAPEVPFGADPVEYTLFESKRGYCDLFATSVVVLARAVNLPARFVTGYAPFHSNPDKSHTYKVYASDYHAWAEFYFKDVGWVVFDATDGAQEMPGRGRGAPNAGTVWYRQTWAIASGICLLIAFVGSLSFWLIRIASRLRTLNSKKRQRAELEHIFIDLVNTMESKTGKPRRPSQTPFEYLHTIKSYLDGSYEAVSLATHAFVGTFYSSAEPDAEGVKNVRTLVQEAKLALKDIKRPVDKVGSGKSNLIS